MAPAPDEEQPKRAKNERVSDEARAAAVADVRKRWGLVGLQVIADDHGISANSLRRFARDAGVSLESSRERTKNATEAQVSTNAMRRAQLAKRLLDAAEACITELDKGSVVHAFSFGELVQGTLKRTNAKDRQSLMIAAGIAIDKSLVLERFDGGSDTTDIAIFLRGLGGA